jgi:flagellar secretion chaperone FliS
MSRYSKQGGGVGPALDSHRRSYEMAYGGHSSLYLDADVPGRSLGWLTPLLYGDLVSTLRRAKLQIEKGDVEGRNASLEEASKIVFELLVSLDRERGCELESRLAALYTFLATEILSVGRSLDVTYLQRLILMVSDLHEAWLAAAEEVAPRGHWSARRRAVQRV